MWVGQLGSGVGIFNGLFLVTAVTQGIDLFIYIVSPLVLLISETQVQKYQLNNEEPAARTPMPVPLSKSYTTNFYLGGTSRYNQSDSPVSRDSLLVLL